MRSYRRCLGQLQAAFWGLSLDTFEPPAGQAVVHEFLKRVWGHRAPATYRTNLSMLHTFFEWHRAVGNLMADPTDGLTYPSIVRKTRRTITRAQAKALLHANPDPRDQVPLRLVLTLGLKMKGLQNLRFQDIDASQRTVTYLRGRAFHSSSMEDDDFWAALQRLTEIRDPAPMDYVMCYEDTGGGPPRKASAAELEEMARFGKLENGDHLRKSPYGGRWHRVRLSPTEMRVQKSVHDWWYRCAVHAGVVPRGTRSGFDMNAARYTVGRRQWKTTGSVSDLQRQMGLRSGGSAAVVYRNLDADSLDTVIRRVRRRLRLRTADPNAVAVGIDGSRPYIRWWKEPVRVFAEYVEDERDLIELSRVSVEMLRTERATSRQLQDASDTLTRAVPATKLVARAQAESQTDHPLLHGHSLVAIWSALETMVGDLIEAWLLSWPSARTHVGALVAVSGLHGLPPDEWAAGARQALDRRYQKLNQKIRSPRRLDHYEWLLAAVGLVAAAQDDDARMAQNLWEMQQIRNAFAHKRGSADARLVANCPHLGFKVKDQIRIDRHAWEDFLVTTVLYADVIVRRMKRELGLSDWLRSSAAPAIRYPHLGGLRLSPRL